MAEFNLKEIFRNSFGYEAPPAFQLPQARARLEYTSKGQPYYMNDLWGREMFCPVTLNGLLIPFAVMSMNWKKTIVSTPMPERGGSVHELISIDDYVFNVKGLCVNEDGNWPESEVINLYELFKINAALEIRSVMSDIVLNGKYNHGVILKSISWPGGAGVEHVQAFQIDLESDEAFELELE